MGPVIAGGLALPALIRVQLLAPVAVNLVVLTVRPVGPLVGVLHV